MKTGGIVIVLLVAIAIVALAASGKIVNVVKAVKGQ